MLTLDAQVHAYERDRPERPWQSVIPGRAEVTGDDMVAAMDALGIDGAVLVSAYSTYKFDASYVLEVYSRHSTRFALVKPVDPHAPDIAEIIADWKTTPGAVGLRVLCCDQVSPDPAAPTTNRVLRLAAQHNLPVNLLCWGELEMASGLAQRNPDTQLIIDHLGLLQPFVPPAPPEPWIDLPKLLQLAHYPNVAVKLTGVCTLSHEPFPYPDIWDPLAQVIDAFGFDRLMWGTDWTRCVELLDYAQGVESFRVTDRLTDSERETLMGGTLQKIHDWSPG